ncbi:MAG: serine/threonine-protein kinase [Isosphaeraceae bacterium]
MSGPIPPPESTPEDPNASGSLAPDELERIVEACERFEGAWERPGQAPPRIEAEVAAAPEKLRPRLLRELLALELELRRRRGEHPRPEEYQARFPGREAPIREAFATAARPGVSSNSARRTSLFPDPMLTYMITSDDGTIQPWSGPSASRPLQDAFTYGETVQARYEVLRELGRGGMGQVFLAHDRRMDRPVALKIILPPPRGWRGGVTDAQLRRSLAEEARIGAGLSHQAIGMIFDYGVHRSRPFIVLEYLSGPSLRDYLAERGRLGPDEVARLIRPLAEALDLAHSRRVLHRDLKPENIREKDPGQYAILDFGLARRFSQLIGGTGFAGTPAYASPEQAACGPLDGRSDQYALALVAYELLAGRRPFAGTDVGALLEQHMSQPPPAPSENVPGLPRSVEQAVLRALEKRPARRFDSCTDFARALARGDPGPRPGVGVTRRAPSGRAGRRPRPALFSWWRWFRPGAHPRRPR